MHRHGPACVHAALMASLAAAFLLTGCGAGDATGLRKVLNAADPSALDYEILRNIRTDDAYITETVYNNFMGMAYNLDGDGGSFFFDASGLVMEVRRDGEASEISPFCWEDLPEDYDRASTEAFRILSENLGHAREEGKEEDVSEGFDRISFSFPDACPPDRVSGIWDPEKTICRHGADNSESAAEPPADAGRRDGNLMDGARPAAAEFTVSKDGKTVGAFCVTLLTGECEYTTVFWNDPDSAAESSRLCRLHSDGWMPALDKERENIRRAMEERGIEYLLHAPD